MPDPAPRITFDLSALYRAVDSKRYRMFKKWPEVANETGVSLSTIRAMNGGSTMEADGVLAIARWIGEPPETWVRPKRDALMLEYIPPDVVWRADSLQLHRRLDEVRIERGLTWVAVADEIGCGSAGTLTRLANGGRISIQLLASAAAWLDEPIGRFTRFEAALHQTRTTDFD